MARHHTCNVCNKKKPQDELKRVQFIEAYMTGVDAGLGLDTDQVTEGEVCTDCVALLHALIGDESSKVRLAENSRPEPKGAA